MQNRRTGFVVLVLLFISAAILLWFIRSKEERIWENITLLEARTEALLTTLDSLQRTGKDFESVTNELEILKHEFEGEKTRVKEAQIQIQWLGAASAVIIIGIVVFLAGTRLGRWKDRHG